MLDSVQSGRLASRDLQLQPEYVSAQCKSAQLTSAFWCSISRASRFSARDSGVASKICVITFSAAARRRGGRWLARSSRQRLPRSPSSGRRRLPTAETWDFCNWGWVTLWREGSSAPYLYHKISKE